MVKSYSKPTLLNLNNHGKDNYSGTGDSILKQQTINNILAYSKALKVYEVKGKEPLDIILN
jgi:hypothetical protein